MATFDNNIFDDGTFCSFFDSKSVEVRDVARNIGLGSQITVKLARLDKSDNRGAHYSAINTDDQVSLVLPYIRKGTNMLQRKWIPNWSSAAVYRIWEWIISFFQWYVK